eukprot:CAMPEP_0198290506 /NCGR_PEP_ID=MMETSP1449-20131203/8344_1 /TAXON_ID=420275 /ORGANISM="Attheya septentrionalis, Strain CCMP2084" /LENGTH=256 /DNA_ID=CAMNT_0043989015 /DNA_START=419 /DNA_END=1189 /DNA_ORIENTATION=-
MINDTCAMMKNFRSATWVALLSALAVTSGLTTPTGRRAIFKSWGTVVLSTVAFESAAGAAITPETVPYQSEVDNFSLSIPSSWTVVTKNKEGQSGQLFSAIDLKSGTVVNVVRERPCEMKLYVEEPKKCDLFIPSTGLLSDETIQRDVSKLVVRYDERDNAVLDGVTRIESFTRKKGSSTGIEIEAVTTIPTGGTYRDGMGLDQPYTLDRIVKGHAVVQANGSLVSIWLSAPADEWNQPVSGIRLRQVYESIKLDA